MILIGDSGESESKEVFKMWYKTPKNRVTKINVRMKRKQGVMKGLPSHGICLLGIMLQPYLLSL